jgi:hypothetical protein
MQDEAEGSCDQHHADGDENRRNANHARATLSGPNSGHPGKYGSFRHGPASRSPSARNLSINVDSQS